MKKNGFTLIELLVVIAIMSILTVITVGQFQNARKKARDVARKGDLNAVSKALLMYYADYGRLPTASLRGELVVDGRTVSWGGGEFTDSTGYVYLKSMPRENTVNANQYCYVTTVDGKKFALFSILENTEDQEYNEFIGSGYSVCNRTNGYNFVYFSPNASITDFVTGQDSG